MLNMILDNSVFALESIVVIISLILLIKAFKKVRFKGFSLLLIARMAFFSAFLYCELTHLVPRDGIFDILMIIGAVFYALGIYYMYLAINKFAKEG